MNGHRGSSSYQDGNQPAIADKLIKNPQKARTIGLANSQADDDRKVLVNS